MKSLTQEVGPYWIRVDGVAPGAIRTDINRDAWERPDAQDALLRRIPTGPIADPDDVAKAAVGLASDESDYVIGTSLFVGGGMLYSGFAGAGRSTSRRRIAMQYALRALTASPRPGSRQAENALPSTVGYLRK